MLDAIISIDTQLIYVDKLDKYVTRNFFMLIDMLDKYIDTQLFYVDMLEKYVDISMQLSIDLNIFYCVMK